MELRHLDSIISVNAMSLAEKSIIKQGGEEVLDKKV